MEVKDEDSVVHKKKTADKKSNDGKKNKVSLRKIMMMLLYERLRSSHYIIINFRVIDYLK